MNKMILLILVFVFLFSGCMVISKDSVEVREPQVKETDVSLKENDVSLKENDNDSEIENVDNKIEDKEIDDNDENEKINNIADEDEESSIIIDKDIGSLHLDNYIDKEHELFEKVLIEAKNTDEGLINEVLELAKSVNDRIDSIHDTYHKEATKEEWSDREGTLEGDKGITLSSYNQDAHLHTYSHETIPNDGSDSVLVSLTYDAKLDSMSMYSLIRNNGTEKKMIRTEFRSDGNDGYYYQEFSYDKQNGDGYHIIGYFNDDYRLIYEELEKVFVSTQMTVCLACEMPDSIDQMTMGEKNTKIVYENGKIELK